MKYLYSISIILAIGFSTIANNANAQPFPQADPAVITITKQGPSDPNPTGSIIVGTAILKFRVANNSAGTAANGKIPAGAVFYTVQFNPYYTYQSLVTSSQFAVTYASPGAPDYVVQLTNTVEINPGDVFDFYLNVIGTMPTTNPNGEIVTLNVDRNVPIQCGNTQTGNDNVSKSFLVSAATTLPVKSIDLSAVLNANNVDLKWTTIDEYNTSSFDIERSTDGRNFTAISSKPASGNTTGPKDYTYQDLNVHLLQSSIIYYRIRMFDINGSFIYSRIVPVKLGKSDTFNVWPNPFRDQVNIRISSATNAPIVISIYNSAGAMVYQQQRTINTGINTITIPTAAKLSSGQYYLEIISGNKKLASAKITRE